MQMIFVGEFIRTLSAKYKKDDNNMKYSISVVIPVYNSEKSLYELYNNLTYTLEKITGKFEIILVDDCSNDSSFSIMEEISLKDKRIKSIRLQENAGQQNAILCGMRHCKYDYIINMDDDLQHNSEDIIALIEKINKGYDIVYAIAKHKEHKGYRNLGSKLTNLFFNIVIKKPKNTYISSFRIFNKEVVDYISATNTNFVYISAIALIKTKNIANIYFTHNKRKYGKSNYDFYKLFKVFMKLYIYYSKNPITIPFRKKGDQYKISEIVSSIDDLEFKTITKDEK